MSISRKLGTLLLFAVPGIIGGGIAYALAGGSYVAVAVFEVALVIAALGFIAR